MKKLAADAIEEWFILYAPLIYTFFISACIALLRGMKDQQTSGKLVEAILCGLISIACAEMLEYVDMPEKVAPFFGGLIGFIGVSGLRELVDELKNRIIKKK